MGGGAGQLTADLLLAAYASGVFPRAEGRDASELFWLDPKQRGIFPLEGFHISRSLARRLRQGGYSVLLNHDFLEVVDTCANRDETWINPILRQIYLDLHDMGHAHSWEIRHPDGRLWGATFGVTLGTAWFGESMVSPSRDGSKIALAHLIDHLRRSGFTLFDTQFLTPHLASLGAVEIPRASYRKALETALSAPADIEKLTPDPSGAQVLQRMTQMS